MSDASRGKSQGLFYAPSPQPSADNVEAIRVWCDREFNRIALVLREGGSQSLRLDVLTVLPPRPFEGQLCYFAAGVAGAGKGIYEYDGSSWNKL